MKRCFSTVNVIGRRLLPKPFYFCWNPNIRLPWGGPLPNACWGKLCGDKAGEAFKAWTPALRPRLRNRRVPAPLLAGMTAFLILDARLRGHDAKAAFETPLPGPHWIGAMKDRTIMDRKVALTGGKELSDSDHPSPPLFPPGRRETNCARSAGGRGAVPFSLFPPPPPPGGGGVVGGGG